MRDQDMMCGTKNKIFAFIGPAEVFVCFLLSVVTTLATEFVEHSALLVPDAYGILLVFGRFLVLTGLTLFARWFFCRLADPAAGELRGRGITRIFESKYSLWILALIIFLCWLPVLAALYPGTVINDSWGQLAQMIRLRSGKWTLSAHHPVVDTVLLGLVILPVARIFGSWQLGFFVYTLLQGALTALSFSASIVYMKRCFHQSNRVSLLFLLVYCLFPVFASAVQTVCKDALAAWPYLLFVIALIEIVRTKASVLRTPGRFWAFAGLCTFCILTKKTNIYIILFSLLLLFLLQKENRKRVFAVIGVLACLYFMILPVVRYVFFIKAGGPQEMLSLPFQQTAVYVIEYGDEVTLEEKEIISKVLVYDDLPTEYSPLNADPIKGYSPRGTTGDYLRYLAAWAGQGLKHPDAYLKATLSHLSGWFSFHIYKPLTNMNWHSQLNPDLIPEDVWLKPAELAGAAQAFDAVYAFLYRLPVVGKALSYAAFSTLLPVFEIATVLRQKSAHKRRFLLALVPLVLSIIIGCYLAPLSVHFEGVRYLYPAVYTAPLYLMLCIALSAGHKMEASETNG